MSGWLSSAAAPFTGADPVGALEAAILDRLRDGFGWAGPRRALKKVEPIDVPFDVDTEKVELIVPPALYLAPLLIRATDYAGTLSTRWALYAVASRATAPARTAGGTDPFGIGVYAIVGRSALLLETWKPPVDGASSLRLIGAESLTGLAMKEKRLAVWALTFEAEISATLENPEAALAEFLIFHADIDLPPLADPAPTELPAAADAAFRVELPER